MKITTHYSAKPPEVTVGVERMKIQIDDVVLEVSEALGGIKLHVTEPLAGMLSLRPGASNMVYVCVETRLRNG